MYKNSYEVPEIFRYIMSKGVEEIEMYRTFNMGIGFVLCVDKSQADAVLGDINSNGKKAYIIGEVVKGGGSVCLK